MTVETRYEHIVLDEKDIAYIEGTRLKVIHLALSHIVLGWSPEELKEQFPPLTMGQIHSAMAYYWDHKEEMDLYIEESYKIEEEFLKSHQQPELITRLKDQGLI